MLDDYQPSASANVEEMAWLVRASTHGRFRLASGQQVAIVGAGPAGLAAAPSVL